MHEDGDTMNVQEYTCETHAGNECHVLQAALKDVGVMGQANEKASSSEMATSSTTETIH